MSARGPQFESRSRGRDGVLAFLGDSDHATVLVIHGNRCGGLAEYLNEEGFDPSAPELGATIST